MSDRSDLRSADFVEPERIYVAAPMTGKPEFNSAAIELAVVALRKGALPGFTTQAPEVFSPVEHDLALGFQAAGLTGQEDLGSLGFSRTDFLLPDLEYIGLRAQGLYLLWDWERSQGVQVELALAALMNLPVMLQGMERWLPAAQVRDGLGTWGHREPIGFERWEAVRKQYRPAWSWAPGSAFSLQRSAAEISAKVPYSRQA